ncbi:Putative glycosyl transferase [hydrothermal vent metagenome]|uniref:Glycosyl transferase n=1 Tax=hydrothermal vent metagenome TaxID=652676 RepID=A0A3B0TK57_9ZZZZ
MVSTFDIVPDQDAGPSRVRPETGFTPLNPAALSAARRLAGEHVQAISPAVLAGLYRAVEGLSLAIVGAGAYYAYVWPGASDLEFVYLAISATTAFVATLIFDALGLYTVPTLARFTSRTMGLLGAWTGLISLLIILAFFTKMGAEFSRGWLAIWFIAGLITLLVERAVMSAFVARSTRSGRLRRRAVIVGGGTRAAELIKALEATPDSGVRICGIFDDRGDDRSPARISGFPKLGTIAELASFARSANIDLLIVSLPYTAEERLLGILQQLWILPVDIRLAAHLNKLRFRPRAYSYIGAVPFFDILDRPLKDWGPVLKSIEDRVLATLALIALSPLMAIVALAVKLESPGPVLFRQHRYGFNNELIEVFKFRSMYVEATDATASELVTKNDPRVTRVGRFIRKTSLDELPQLLNVLAGDLSLVGPRPHATSAKAANQLYGDVVDGYFARHRVKPGITGWAQVNGWRGETDTADKIVRRVEHDLYYIENWSVLFDLYILAITPLSLLNTDQAY